jgi:hypothetical protein
MNPFGGTGIQDITAAIQLSLTPVFLLSGIGVLLTMLTNRLGRILDRADPLEDEYHAATGVEAIDLAMRLRALALRARLAYSAITLASVSALLIAIVVLLVFASAFERFHLATPVALLFIGSMLALAGSLICFFVEVQLATRSLRIGKGIKN